MRTWTASEASDGRSGQTWGPLQWDNDGHCLGLSLLRLSQPTRTRCDWLAHDDGIPKMGRPMLLLGHGLADIKPVHELPKIQSVCFAPPNWLRVLTPVANADLLFAVYLELNPH